MNFKLLPVSQEDLTDYKKDMQEAAFSFDFLSPMR